ncbi:MAG TPA: hypothetical protein VGG75_36735 [Trebonia sp.]
MVTSPDAFTGENFRRGGYLERGDRYVRAAEFVQTARELWESWPPGSPEAGTGPVSGDGRLGAFRHQGLNFDISGTFTAAGVRGTPPGEALPGGRPPGLALTRLCPCRSWIFLR